jgi:putative ABC transport system ATP-binding protein
MLRADEISFGFSSGRDVVSAVSLRIGRGESVAVVGQSGSGKSTLLNLLAGIFVPGAGEILWDGRVISKLGSDARAELRLRDGGFVFQSSELIPELNLRDNIALPLRLLGMPTSKVSTLMHSLRIESLAHRLPAEVSGGERQRAALARALAHEPQIVFADEPTGALDREAGAVVMGELQRLVKVHGTALVLVTHDRDLAQGCDRVVHLVDGRIVDRPDFDSLSSPVGA